MEIFENGMLKTVKDNLAVKKSEHVFGLENMIYAVAVTGKAHNFEHRNCEKADVLGENSELDSFFMDINR